MKNVFSNMRVVAIVVSILAFLTVFAAAQQGTAPPGYYPMGYNLDTWSGTITAVNPDTREITLTYKGKTEESFTGVLKPGYTRTKDGKPFEVPMADIPVGFYMTAFYMPKTKKVDGKKTKYYEIFDFKLYRTDPKK